MHQLLQVYQVYTSFPQVFISPGKEVSGETNQEKIQMKNTVYLPPPKVIIPWLCAGILEQCRHCMGQTALHTAVGPVAAGIRPEVENIRTSQLHDFWESSYQNQHPTLAFVLSLISSFPFSLSFAHPLLGISSISPPLSSPFPCSRLFPDNLSSPNVYLPLLGPLLQLLPGRRFLLH